MDRDSKWHSYVIKDLLWKTRREVKPVSKKVGKDYVWNDNKGEW